MKHLLYNMRYTEQNKSQTHAFGGRKMVRKSVFSREDVVKAGFDLVDKLGLDQLTARNLAEEIGSSTAPVYSNFSNMDQLEEALVDEAVKRLMDTTRQDKSGNQFLNIGLGFLDFAWKHPRWYEALFQGKTQQTDPGFKIMEEILESMATMPVLADLHETERTIVLKKMAIFTHGMATEICTNQGAKHSPEEWNILLDEVGQTIMQDALQRKPRNAEELKILGSLCHCDNHETTEKEED